MDGMAELATPGRLPVPSTGGLEGAKVATVDGAMFGAGEPVAM